MKEVSSKLSLLSVAVVVGSILFIKNVHAEGIDPSATGLANELSEQAKVVAGQYDVLEAQDKEIKELQERVKTLEMKASSMVARAEAMRARLELIETAESERVKKDAQRAYVDAEVERRLSGVQDQITILHASKASKDALQNTRDQAARVIKQLKK